MQWIATAIAILDAFNKYEPEIQKGISLISTVARLAQSMNAAGHTDQQIASVLNVVAPALLGLAHDAEKTWMDRASQSSG